MAAVSYSQASCPDPTKNHFVKSECSVFTSPTRPFLRKSQRTEHRTLSFLTTLLGEQYASIRFDLLSCTRIGDEELRPEDLDSAIEARVRSKEKLKGWVGHHARVLQIGPGISDERDVEWIPPSVVRFLNRKDVLDHFHDYRNDIGKGSYGTVHRVGNFAFKLFRAEFNSHLQLVEMKGIYLEETLLRILQSSGTCVVPYICSFDLDTKRVIVMKTVGDQNLSEFIQSRRSSPITAHEIAAIVLQILDFLAFMRSRDMVHGDLKPKNIQVEQSGRICILDFGLAKQRVGNLLVYGNRTPPTCWYRAPDARKLFPEGDMWALGCIIGEMVFQGPVFSAPTEKGYEKFVRTAKSGTFGYIKSAFLSKIKERVRFFNFTSRDPACDSSFYRRQDQMILDLFEHMTNLDPRERITPEKALQHDFFDLVTRVQFVFKSMPTILMTLRISALYQGMQREYQIKINPENIQIVPVGCKKTDCMGRAFKELRFGTRETYYFPRGYFEVRFDFNDKIHGRLEGFELSGPREMISLPSNQELV